jgi:hypothetical protein
MNRNLRGRLERLERDQPDPDNGKPSRNFFNLLAEVYILGTVDVADLSPTDRTWVEKFRGVFVTAEAPNQECNTAGMH